MRIKIDENISRHLKPLLTQEGHEAATAGEEGLLGKADAEVGAAAKAEGMLLFTLDLEFADLRKFLPEAILEWSFFDHKVLARSL
jgi:predicted nuclease of predicted toxin-antitoxin system